YSNRTRERSGSRNARRRHAFVAKLALRVRKFRLTGGSHRDGSVTQDGADALDRVEVLALAQSPDRPTVGERLVHREVEPVAALLLLRPVHLTVPMLCG